MLTDVKITSDNFMVGQTKITKGSIYPCLPVVARYIVGQGNGVVIPKPKTISKAKPKTKPKDTNLDDILGLDEVEKPVKKVPKKKGAYKTRVVKPES